MDADIVVVWETPRLILRQFRQDDVELLVELDSDPAVMRYLTGGRPTARSRVESDVMPAFLSYYARYEAYGFWAAVEKASQELIGWFHLRPRGEAVDDEPELGYRLRRSAWGKGFATEGAVALIERAFTVAGARRVYAETMAVNAGSRRVMEKAGMRLVRTFRQEGADPIDGYELGGVEYAITRTEWERTRAL